MMIVMGRVAAPFGVKDWIKIQPFTQAVDALLGYRAWWLGQEGRWDSSPVEDGAVHGRSLIAKLQGCDDRDAAGRLKGLQVALPRSALPASADGEYYWADLIGLEVVNREGVSLGRVTGLMETGASHVLVVRAERELLIPFAEPVIESVDVGGGRVIVDWRTDL
jgi:16S rRNA processing protein RimM